MDEQTRQQVTWIVIITLVSSLVVFVVYRQIETDLRLATIAQGNAAERLAAVEPLIERQRLPDALEEAPRWVQDRAVSAAMMLGTPRAMQQLIAAKPVVDAPVAAQIDEYLIQMGEAAVGPLVLSVQDRDGGVRGAAGGPLREIGAPAVLSLMSLIDVYDDAVRGLVSSTLGRIGEPSVEPLLKVMIQDSPAPDQGPAAFRRSKSAAEAAFKAMGETAFEPVIGQLLFYEDDAEVRLAATDILGAVAQEVDDEIAVDAVDPLITVLNTDEAWAVRRRAAEALGRLGDVARDNGAVEPLIAQMQHERSEVRASAAEALGRLEDPAAAGPLVDLLLTNRIGATAEIAVALERIGRAAIEPITPALDHPEVEVRLTAAQTLATIGTSESVIPLGRALGDPEVKVRRAAASALRHLADERVLDQVAAALGDGSSEVYYSARDALVRLGSPAIPVLLNSLGSENTRVAFIAQQALSRIGAPAITPLINGVHSANERIARWSAIALGNIGEESVEPMASLVNDVGAPLNARAEAARGLGITGSYTATAPLEEAAQTAPAPVRVQAISALGAIGDERATETLVNALDDESESVRREVTNVLIGWRLADVDERLAEVVERGEGEAARRAAVVLAHHTPEAAGELMRAIGLDVGEVHGESPEVRRLLHKTVADARASQRLRELGIVSLSYVGTEDALDALAPLLQAEYALALPTARAIGQIGRREADIASLEEEILPTDVEISRAAQLLLGVFDTTDQDDMRLIAASGLAVMGVQPVEPLIERVKTASDARRAWIIATLGAIGRPATDRILDARGREDDEEIRNWLAAGLVLIGDARALDLIRQLPEDEQPREDRIEAGQVVFSELVELI